MNLHCDVVSQDLKPSNILFDGSGTLKLADFGMSVQWSGEPIALHPNVVTPWYRAPELLLNTRDHCPAVDLWSAACIFAELMIAKPLFDGMSDLALIKQITDLLGSPSLSNWPVRELQLFAWFGWPRNVMCVLQGLAKVKYPFCFPDKTPVDLTTIIPAEYGPEAVDLLSK